MCIVAAGSFRSLFPSLRPAPLWRQFFFKVRKTECLRAKGQRHFNGDCYVRLERPDLLSNFCPFVI